MSLDGITARQVQLAEAIIRAVKDRGLPKRAGYVAMTTACAENGYGRWGLAVYQNDGTSTLRDAYLGRQLNAAERAVARESQKYAAPGDPVGRNLDSMGLYQQRPMSGWGSPRDLMDPAKSAGKFLDGAGGNRGLTDISGWEDMEIYAAGQKVQGSLPKDAWLYQQWQPKGVQIVDELWDTVTPSGVANNGEKDWVDMATLQDLDNALDKLADKVVKKVFDAQVWAGTDAYGADRGTPGPPFHQLISALLKTNEDQSEALVDLGAQVEALRGQVRELKAAK